MFKLRFKIDIFAVTVLSNIHTWKCLSISVIDISDGTDFQPKSKNKNKPIQLRFLCTRYFIRQ